MTPFSQGCTKLMEGKDKTENKKDIVELLRKLADMLEEQEYTNTKLGPVITRPIGWDDLTNPTNTKLQPAITRPIVDTWDDIANPNWQYPDITYPDYPDQNGGILPRGPRFQSGGQLQPQAYVIADEVDCALWDDGSCGRKAAKGDKNESYGFIHPIRFQKKCHSSVYFC